MSNPIKDAKNQINEIIMDALGRAVGDGALPAEAIPSFLVEEPNDKTHGDFACNVALVSAKAFKTAPRKIAEEIVSRIELKDSFFERFEVAGAGFINFFLSDSWFEYALSNIIKDGENFGRSDFGKNEKVMVEFVSANPTGPMHIGNARGGGLGDCLAAVLDAAGYDVTREFYVNDAGNQIEKFGKSLSARYLQKYLGEDKVEFPEDGYHGADIIAAAEEFASLEGDKFVSAPEEERQNALVNYALPKNIKRLKEDLEKYRINYDVWFLESELHKSGAVKAVVDTLTEKGLTYEKDGAIWYRASEFTSKYSNAKAKDEDEVKDEVLVRANGNPTYFTADIAYHYNKFVTRNFSRVINVWGADHHGHVARLKGAMDAMGLDGNRLDIVLMQLVRLMRDGEVVRVSKRTGKSITLTDLLEEVPIDAARFFFNLREPNSHLDFDLGLAVEEDSKNPVYYVQYAHARICSILKNLSAEGITPNLDTNGIGAILKAPEERDLLKHLSCLPSEIIESARAYDPARITRYVIDLATLFHKFYNACRVKGDDEALMQARLTLCKATKNVIFNVLTLLKVGTPESM